jgi:hypothetical protein
MLVLAAVAGIDGHGCEARGRKEVVMVMKVNVNVMKRRYSRGHRHESKEKQLTPTDQQELKSSGHEHQNVLRREEEDRKWNSKGVVEL